MGDIIINWHINKIAKKSKVITKPRMGEINLTLYNSSQNINLEEMTLF